MKRTLFLITIFFISLSSLFSQVNSIFTPFVSRIKVEAGQSSIKIHWKDSTDVSGNCLIYRHTQEINSENFNDAVKIASVPQGIEYYEDFPPYVKTDYFYGIFMEDENSLIHEIFIPLRNLTIVSSEITEKTKDNTPALITFIKAWESTDSIELSFKCSKPSAELFIYRNTEPIEDQNDILKANLIATLSGRENSYTDYPVPGIGYYYGIIDSNLIKTGNYNFKAGENVTIVPVELQLKSVERVGLPEMPDSRPKPLPYLSISRAYQTGRQLSPSIMDIIPPKKEISIETEKAINGLTLLTAHNTTTETETGSTRKPIILNQNKLPSPGSEQAMLTEILNSDFINGNYETAMIKLLDFQKIKRDKEIEASVHFYLGQIYYFLEDYNKSFKEFLFAEDYLYSYTREWIDVLYRNLRI